MKEFLDEILYSEEDIDKKSKRTWCSNNKRL